MATRCLILKEDGKSLKGINCHYDGYPDHVGLLLDNYYNTTKMVEALISLGDISVLDKKLEPTTKSHSFDTPEKGVTIAYARDRGEKLEIVQTTRKELEKLAKDNWAEYVYIYNGKVWNVLTLNEKGKLV